jgi:hypothetical protein
MKWNNNTNKPARVKELLNVGAGIPAVYQRVRDPLRHHQQARYQDHHGATIQRQVKTSFLKTCAIKAISKNPGISLILV